jgi:hypothetical protein
MSRGPGRVQRAIESVFRDNPSATFSTEELVAHVYPGINRIEKAHRVAVLRALPAVAERMWWRLSWAESHGHPVIAYNLLDIISYATGRLRASFGARSEEIPQMLTDIKSNVESIAPGGAWWTHVQINHAIRDGRHDEAVELRAKLEGISRKLMLGQ